ncbi:efflux RND transporter permease subunit [Porticoccus sp. Uisw_050_02]|uniref:efflux RND transporter permease subunit n=1 Tax=Porticoccus sp. Uisw_050_02 TaxID=3230978 RepID=UPI0039E8C495
MTIIDLAFSRSRTVLLGLLFVLIFGATAYQNIPKEAEPDIAIPFIYVSMRHEGISPEDAERLLVKPMEKELQSITGLKEMKSTSGEGYASVQLEFSAGFDSKKAKSDVREKVDTAKTELPDDTDEPDVIEINVALFPVLTVSLSGPVPETSLVGIARSLKDRIESLPGVLEANIGGDREAILEIVVDPAVMETYQVKYEELFSFIRNNNLLVAAGALDSGAGRLVLKVPGVIENMEDALSMPVKVEGDRVVTFGEVASIKRSYKDPSSFARVGGQAAVTLEIKKRVGANIIETINDVRELVEAERKLLPASLEVRYMQDKSNKIRAMLNDLQNNILSAIILVVIIMIAALGFRSALLVGLAIPSSFLAAILVLNTLGYTLNIVVLFSLILVVGMLVDGAIIVVELADRRMNEGMLPQEAYLSAAKRMAWPITTSTITTLAVFMPLLVWPGMVGEFMKFLPITVIIALIASLSMALIFIPVLGKAINQKNKIASKAVSGPITEKYIWFLGKLLKMPVKTLGIALAVMTSVFILYGFLSKGLEFFPEVEPEFGLIQIQARGDLSIYEKDKIVRKVEDQISGMKEIRSVYARSFNKENRKDTAADVIGTIQLEFLNWDERRPAVQIFNEMRELTSGIPGIKLEFRKSKDGPGAGKPIHLEFNAYDFSRVPPAVKKIRQLMEDQGGYVDIEDNLPLPGIEWQIEVDRALAARYGADIATLGQSIRMVTSGIKVTDYRPDDNDDEVDVMVRFPASDRHLGQLDQLRISTAAGMIPIRNFVTIQPAPKSGSITRVNAHRTITLKADVAEDVLPDTQLKALVKILKSTNPDSQVYIHFKGEDKEKREAMQFLLGAFLTALILMALVLVTQFNSIYQALLVLSAIVFSTTGVLLGLLITAQPFGIVMVGLGIIALAGIVVNNNIVLIDTYNRMRKNGFNPIDAALETGRRRLRPVFLTAFTTVLGLMPMVLAMNIDLFDRSISFGAPSTQWWTQLASAIAGGLAFATLLTLALTPCLLVMGEELMGKLSSIKNIIPTTLDFINRKKK